MSTWILTVISVALLRDGRWVQVLRRGADAAELPVAAERRRHHLLARGGLGADIGADRRRPLDDVVAQHAEALDLDLDDVAGLDRTREGGRAAEQQVARHER